MCQPPICQPWNTATAQPRPLEQQAHEQRRMALEHGQRAAPSFEFVQRVTGFLNVIWDEAEDLQRLAHMSDPRVTINTSGLSPKATELANLLARRITTLKDEDLNLLLKTLRR